MTAAEWTANGGMNLTSCYGILRPFTRRISRTYCFDDESCYFELRRKGNVARVKTFRAFAQTTVRWLDTYIAKRYPWPNRLMAGFGDFPDAETSGNVLVSLRPRLAQARPFQCWITSNEDFPLANIEAFFVSWRRKNTRRNSAGQGFRILGQDLP